MQGVIKSYDPGRAMVSCSATPTSGEYDLAADALGARCSGCCARVSG